MRGSRFEFLLGLIEYATISFVLLARRPRGARSRQGGFTLIEVMIAMLLLLIGVAGVLSLQMTSVRATSFSRHATEATVAAEDKMEELMSMDGDTLLAMSLLLPGTDTTTLPSGGTYVRTWTIVPGTVNLGVLSVSVTVDWVERGSENHSIEIDTQRRP